jgi:hypothetical protein
MQPINGLSISSSTAIRSSPFTARVDLCVQIGLKGLRLGAWALHKGFLEKLKRKRCRSININRCFDATIGK